MSNQDRIANLGLVLLLGGFLFICLLALPSAWLVRGQAEREAARHKVPVEQVLRQWFPER